MKTNLSPSILNQNSLKQNKKKTISSKYIYNFRNKEEFNLQKKYIFIYEMYFNTKLRCFKTNM